MNKPEKTMRSVSRHGPFRTWMLLTTLLAIWLTGFSLPTGNLCARQIDVSAATGDDALMVDGLRRRRLFDLAEKYCNQRLADPELNVTARTSLVIELIRTQTARAAVAPANESQARWDAATKTAAEFVDANRNQPRVLLVEVQKALIHLTHGRLIQQQIDADIVPASARELALAELNTCNTSLADISRRVAVIMPDRRVQGPAEHELTIEQLTALESNVQFQSAMCTLNRASLYPPDDQLNRINALGIAIEGFEAVRRRTASNQPVWWENELAAAECFRLLGNLPASKQVLDALPLDEASESNRQAVLRERILNAIAAGDAGQERRLVDLLAAIGVPDAELSLAGMKLLMSLSQTDPANSGNWQSLAAAQISKIENTHGAYWGRLAELQLIGTPAATADPTTGHGNGDTNMPATADLDILLRTGDQAVRKGNLDDAIRFYTQAVTGADAAGNSEIVFATTISLSRIFEQKKQHADASAMLIDIARRFPDHTSAAAVHLRGCWNLAQVLTTLTDPATQKNEQTRFQQLLNDNILHWPAAETRDQARVWLAGNLQDKKQWEQAAETWLNVSSSSKWAVEAIRQAGVCKTKQLAQTGPEQPPELMANQYTEILHQHFEQIGSVESDTWTDLHTAIVISIAEVQTGFGSANDRLVPLLQRTVASCSTDLRNEATAWLIVAMANDLADAGEPNVASLNESAASIAGSLPALRRCDAGLARLIDRRPEIPVLHEARLLITTAAMTRELEPAEAIAWRGRHADALVAAGRHAEAVSMLEALVKEQPESATVQMQLARCLTTISGDEAQTRALIQWRRIERKLKRGSENWFEAKYHIALLVERSGDRERALKLLQYDQATGVDWSKSEFAEQFDELLKRCGG